ncbi:hypothetical protein [Oenococcus sp.]|uniref:hypothetical protein n=1 Tax=Oenococcus sp. TaxID=1979414 RepID=UPI0039EB262B
MVENESRFSAEQLAALIRHNVDHPSKQDWFTKQDLLAALLFGHFFLEVNFRYKTAAGRSYLLLFTSEQLAKRVLKDDFNLNFPLTKELMLDQAIQIVKNEGLNGIIFDHTLIDYSLTAEDYETSILPRADLLEKSLHNDAILKQLGINDGTALTENAINRLSFIVPGHLFEEQEQEHHSYLTLHNGADESNWIPVFTDLAKLKEWSQEPFAKHFYDPDITVFALTKNDLLQSEKIGDFYLDDHIAANGIVIDAPIRAQMGQIVQLKEEE